jgi:hypothetical protein
MITQLYNRTETEHWRPLAQSREIHGFQLNIPEMLKS